MTLSEINTAISKLRGYIKPPEHCCGAGGFGLGVDDVCPACEEPTWFNESLYRAKFKLKENQLWLADAHWPTLLRELPTPELFQYTYSKEWRCNGVQAATINEAVCRAWIKWKTK